MSQLVRDDAAKSRGLLKVLKSEQFVKYLHFMIDVTSVLSKLSVQFQKDDNSINEVLCGIERSITQLKELEKGGVYYQAFCNRYSEPNSKLMCGKDNKKEVALGCLSVSTHEYGCVSLYVYVMYICSICML